MKRRQFLKLSAVASGTFAVGGVIRTASRPAAAQTTAPPAVDRLVMTNVVDYLHDVFAKSAQLQTIGIQRNLSSPLSGSGPRLLAEHGLAYHLESFRGSEHREILLDFGLTDIALLNNYRALQVDPTRADALIVSHGHTDHVGGLSALALALQGKSKAALTLYAGGEDTFCHRVSVTAAGTIDQGQLDRPGLEARGPKIELAKLPTIIAGQALTSGQIARLTDFEKSPAAARVIAGPMDSVCSATHFGTVKIETKPGEMVVDTFQGEHATAYHVKDRGLVVITSCGHAGVINSVRQVQTATGIDKVHAIVGGFHLAPASDEVVAKTVAAFKTINPDYIIPAHCTGVNTMMTVNREMPGKLVMPSTGTRVIFGA